MHILAILKIVLPSILALMDIAERVFNQPKSGENKKAWVLGAAEAIVKGMTDVSTGGQKETWEAIGELASPLIDKATDLAFPHSSRTPDSW